MSYCDDEDGNIDFEVIGAAIMNNRDKLFRAGSKIFCVSADAWDEFTKRCTLKNTAISENAKLDFDERINAMNEIIEIENNENLVKVENNQIVTSSRQVAKTFEKEHKNVIQSIEKLKAENSALTSMFYETSYRAGTGKAYKEYLMNRDGFSLLVMGFTGAKALEWKIKYIQAFNAMEKALAPAQDSYMIADPIERAKRWIEEQAERNNLLETTKRQEQVILELKPKADYMDDILQNKGLTAITQIAKDYGMSGRAMNTKLHELGIIYKLGEQWLLYSKYQSCGYTHSETVAIKHSDGRADVKLNTKWTQKGRLFLYNKLKCHGILPTIELSR